jgi:hydroxymethylpyrimidine pyrophosphatase-like HAD family hydrolase
MEFLFGRAHPIAALATDYDGTLAENGVVSAASYDALLRFKATGRALLLVTGRELDDLKRVFPNLAVFDCVVAENGALLYDPSTGEEHLLAPPPSMDLIRLLRASNVSPLSVGRCIVATWEPHETIALECIKELKLELQIIFNKGAVMILPANVNKASGLAAALEKMKIPREAVVGVGDAENDHGFLRACGLGVAVANALDALKQTADAVTKGSRGAGVVELIEEILRADEKREPAAPAGGGRAGSASA